jgi:hypothetical protein
MTCRRLSKAASRPVGMLGKSFGQADLSMSMALAFAARSSSSAGRCAAVGCTTSEMRSIGQSVSCAASSLQTSAARRSASFVAAYRLELTPRRVLLPT